MLVTGKDRTLVANIAAANNFKEHHLQEEVLKIGRICCLH